MTNKRKIINDPVYDGFLTIEDDIIFDVLSHPYFQRQRRIKQLGFTCLVYPGAMHTRFSHMLGALNLMNRALEVLKVKGVELTNDEMLGAKLAILMHDIGHGPFSHTSERTLADMPHEECSRLYMERLNREFGGRLTTAISIFDDEYPKHFLHQLVSSQLDMDRLDYLGRRLMYWQVYLHKTVVSADTLLMNILRRARELASSGKPLGIEGLPLHDFLSHHYTQKDFEENEELLDRFALIDDSDVDMAVKCWMKHEDKVLRMLSEHLVNRHLSAIKVSDQPFAPETVETFRVQTQLLYGIDERESEYFVNTGILKNHAYDYNDQEIRVLFKDGSCRDIGDASDQLDRHFLEKQVTKYYIYFPKELKSL